MKKPDEPIPENSGGDIFGDGTSKGGATSGDDIFGRNRLKQLQARLTKSQRQVLQKLENDVANIYTDANVAARRARRNGQDDKSIYAAAEDKALRAQSGAMQELEQKGIKNEDDRRLLTEDKVREGEAVAARNKPIP